MAELLRTVKLRNRYWVYQEAHGYRVDQVDRDGQTNSVSIPQSVVDYLYHALEGSRVDAGQAERVLANVPEGDPLSLQSVGGCPLEFYAQDVLLVLVALKKATCMNVNHQFIYTIGQ